MSADLEGPHFSLAEEETPFLSPLRPSDLLMRTSDNEAEPNVGTVTSNCNSLCSLLEENPNLVKDKKRNILSACTTLKACIINNDYTVEDACQDQKDCIL